MAKLQLNEDWVDRIAERVFKFVTDNKRDALYHQAKHDPKLARDLKDMEDNLAELQRNIEKLKQY